jgi:hypothetical protein
MADTTFDSFGNVVPVGDPSAASADPSGLAETYLDTLKSGDFSGIKFSDIKNLLSGDSSYGAAGQLLGFGGIGALLSKIMGGGGGGYAGYQGGIPKYTASRQQYAVPTSGTPSTYRPSDTEIRDYISRPGVNDAMIARSMNEYGVSPERMAGLMQLPTAQIQSRYQNAIGPNMMARRPGSGGVTYFSPMQYSTAPVANAVPNTIPAPDTTPVSNTVVEERAGGGMLYGSGGITNLGGYSDGGQLLRGPGDGVSDSIPAMIGKKQPARLADGEFVVPARIVSELGNGSTEAGARKLYAMMDRIKKTRSKAKNIAANTKADKHLPA